MTTPCPSLNEDRDPEERYSGWTPLMKASEEGLVEIMRLLLKKSVDVEAKNKKGRSALSFAAAPSINGSTTVRQGTFPRDLAGILRTLFSSWHSRP